MTLDPDKAAAATAAQGTPEQARQIRKAAIASTVGTTIEWYDYFLYGTAAALVFPKVFFPDSSHYVGAAASRSPRTSSASRPDRSAPRSSGTGATGSAARSR